MGVVVAWYRDRTSLALRHVLEMFCYLLGVYFEDKLSCISEVYFEDTVRTVGTV